MSTIRQNSTLMQIYLIAFQEVKSSFANKRGLLIALVFSILWLLLLIYPIQFAANSMQNSDTSSFVAAILDGMGLSSLQNWLFAELAMYWLAALLLFPYFSLLMSVDQLITERNRGGLRFLVLRSYRQSIFLGRFLGQLIIQAGFIFITLLITYTFILINNSDVDVSALALIPLIFLNLLLVTVPFIALMSFFSIIMKSVVMSYVMVIIFFLSMKLINYLLSIYLPAFDWLQFLVPGYQLGAMMDQSPAAALTLLWIPILQGIGLLLVGFGLFKRLEL